MKIEIACYIFFDCFVQESLEVQLLSALLHSSITPTWLQFSGHHKSSFLLSTEIDMSPFRLLLAHTCSAQSPGVYFPVPGHCIPYLVGGEGSGLVGADDGRASERLDGRQRADNGVLLGHTAGSEREASGDDGGQTLIRYA